MKRHKLIVSVFSVFPSWLTIFTFSIFFTSNCFAQISDADDFFLANSKPDRTLQKAEEVKGEKPIFVDPIPRVDVVEMYKELHPNASNFDTQKEQKETDELEKDLQRNRKEFEASLQKEQELTEEIHRQNERQKEELKQLEQHRTSSIFGLIGEAFNAVIGFFTLVICAVFFVFLIKSIVKQHRRYKEQMMNRKSGFNSNYDKYDKYNVNQPQPSTYSR